MHLLSHQRFVYDHMMDVGSGAEAISRIAAAIGEPARARMLAFLMAGQARTSTELAVVAEVSPSTASVHLNRLRAEHLVTVVGQGRHHYYSLEGPAVASALEGLGVLAGRSPEFVSTVQSPIREARTCYDHIAGTLGVSLCDRLLALGWLSASSRRADNSFELTAEGAIALEVIGVDIEAARQLRRRFAFACLDWTERRPHVGGAFGAAILGVALKRKWVIPDLNSRALHITNLGRREMLARFGLRA